MIVIFYWFRIIDFIFSFLAFIFFIALVWS